MPATGKPLISVVIAARNEEILISDCLSSILMQDFKDFEVIVVDDASTDRTCDIISGMNDPRIHVYHNARNLGPAKSRNIGWRKARGDYIVFTDADCLALDGWLKRVIDSYKKPGVVGVEGVLLYRNAGASVSYEVMQNLSPGQYLTGNVSYTREVLEAIGGFDERFRYLEDRVLGISAAKHGEMAFNPKMVVIHRERKRTASFFFFNYRNYYIHWLKLYKYYGVRPHVIGRILYPADLVVIFFPFILLIYYKIASWEELFVIAAKYFGMIYGRLCLWQASFRERFFLI